jgi:hypothetical protein
MDPRAMVRLEGLGKLENPVTLWGIKPETIRLVVQSLNQLCYNAPSLVVLFQDSPRSPDTSTDISVDFFNPLNSMSGKNLN